MGRSACFPQRPPNPDMTQHRYWRLEGLGTGTRVVGEKKINVVTDFAAFAVDRTTATFLFRHGLLVRARHPAESPSLS